MSETEEGTFDPLGTVSVVALNSAGAVVGGPVPLRRGRASIEITRGAPVVDAVCYRNAEGKEIFTLSMNNRVVQPGEVIRVTAPEGLAEANAKTLGLRVPSWAEDSHSLAQEIYRRTRSTDDPAWSHLTASARRRFYLLAADLRVLIAR